MATVNRNVIKVMLIRTELGGEKNISWAYQLRNAGTLKSGYSFGQPQWDLASGNGIDTFEDILTNATFDNKLSETDITRIMEIVAIKNENLTTALKNELATYTDRINSALSSEYGKQEINAQFETWVDVKIGRIDSLVAELRAYGREQVADYIANNSLVQMMLIDYDNQLGIDGIDSIGNFTDTNDGKLLQYLKDGETTINNGTLITVKGDFDIKDYLDFLFNTKQGFNSLEDVIRRLSEIAKTASENLIGGDMLTDLQKLLLEAKDKILDICDLFLRNREINNSLSTLFLGAQRLFTSGADPFVLDLDNDGIETVGINTNNPILFDHNADGVKTATGWIGPDDGLLVLDRNNNGTIDSGRELFGDNTQLSAGGNAADGFAALADLDSNADGQIDANDAQFANLRVWRDLNQDGVSQSNELSTLEQQNIASISLTTTQNNQLLPDGNRVMDLGTYTKVDGTTGTTGATGQTAEERKQSAFSHQLSA